MKGLKLAGILATGALLAACSAQQLGSQAQSSTDVWQAPAQVTVAAVAAKLDSYLWLNSMPSVGDSANKGLLASVKLVSTNGQALPSDIEVTQVLLVTDKAQWQNEKLLPMTTMDNGFEVMLRDGPSWMPGEAVDIAMTFIYQGQRYTVTQRQVKIDQVF
ncbi:hypothetical protein A3K86_11085 [Photobacterium jeanii]|uniref:Uncharacterized protein n=1 Tax=Photobacterium jeanii TaxID=858640 RepID=A0A178KAY0_9GAMM|nr:hypothetical protein [Photobacterium jeanii]OAN14125.1 hypothetical protein A3K86_11085 [Photobacterium jeanii]PST89642.1 hypothetical protein C9I91_11695 [Photobacterium jeanii]